jgi:hypothetical protein
MSVELKAAAQPPPRGKILKEAATGNEREEALRNIWELSRLAGERTKALGMTAEDVQKLIDES